MDLSKIQEDIVFEIADSAGVSFTEARHLFMKFVSGVARQKRIPVESVLVSFDNLSPEGFHDIVNQIREAFKASDGKG
jgi:hypothetical protein